MKQIARTIGPAVARLILLGLAAAVATGCNQTSGVEFRLNQPSRLELTSFKDPYFPESYQITLRECATWTDRSGDIHVVGRATSDFAGVSVAPVAPAAPVDNDRAALDGGVPATAPAAAEPAPVAAPFVQQYLHIQVYWRPRPGRTPAADSLHDALLRYVAATEAGVSQYEGSGFVSTRTLADGRLAVAVERAELRRVAGYGAPPDVLGVTRVKGLLLAQPRAGDAVDHLREMQQVAAQHQGPLGDLGPR